MPKTNIVLWVPHRAFDRVEVEYTTAGVHDKHRYNIVSMHRTYYGKLVEELDVAQMLRLNDQKEIDRQIIEATQGHYRPMVEADNKNFPDPNKKIRINTKKKGIPE